jgi:hypothetical protein
LVPARWWAEEDMIDGRLRSLLEGLISQFKLIFLSNGASNLILILKHSVFLELFQQDKIQHDYLNFKYQHLERTSSIFLTVSLQRFMYTVSTLPRKMLNLVYLQCCIGLEEMWI